MADENNPLRANVDSSHLRRGKTIEQIYQKKTPLEHILLRPDTYVGSTEHQLQEMWVFDESRGQMVYRKIDYVPALYKIFDEILVNAADNMKRDHKMDTIDVKIDRQQGCVSVMNNGHGVPVEIHKEHKCYVPELIFGHLLTSDNYDDTEKKVTGGRNGYGAKLTNVFSKRFIIETADNKSKKKFTQVFENNMTKKNSPKLEDHRGAEYTRVTFWPDFSRFGMTGLDVDITSLMMKRVYDVAGSTNKKCRVLLNGKQLPVKSFQDYVNMYLNHNSSGTEVPLIHEQCSDRWEVAVSITDGAFQQVSFVNSICTVKGGTHVTHVTEQLIETILKVVRGKNRGGIDIKPAHVRNHLWVFINSLIENPAFDSQTKETLTTKQSKFGSTCELSDKMMKQVMKSGVVELILDWARAKQKVDIARQLRGATKNTGRVLGIPKLEDANDAGGRNSQDCTLILTEGDSAKSLAVAGLSIVGRDKFGVFPLKGKVLNVRDANYKQVTGNNEIQNILKIMGLDLKADYSEVGTGKLRYGSIMLMTDQDHDGSHIKGLLINLVHHWWPSLVSMKGFLKEFVTPIVKVWRPGGKENERKDETSFYTLMEYEAWKQRSNNGKGWKTKYYKGLGTSTMKEAKEYFQDIEKHELAFRWTGPHDGEAIDLAFNKKRADDRKEWINAYEDGQCVDHSKSIIGYSEFINKELVQFAKYDVSRSVPSVVDGFKPGQRKVLYCSFKKKLKSDIKVAQFVGYISEQSAYHHGETSLENTIVNLAQTFVGSNNVNLLVPSGQFGTRLQGGKDHAAARYIYTRLHPATRTIFHPDDDAVLDHLDEEGMTIEPRWYCPIIPTVLVNGADGIGVGWSTFIPNYNPRDLIRNIRGMLRGQTFAELHPWYKGYRGSIMVGEQEGKYEVLGTTSKKSDSTLEITELPVKTWTQNYKEFLEELMPADKKDEESSHVIEDFREYHTESTVHFVCQMTSDRLRKAEGTGLEKVFKLKSSLCITNMVLFDADGKITKYNSALDILVDFCRTRFELYDKRKAYLVAKLTREKEILSNKARFILMVVKGELELRRKKKAELLRELKQLGFTPMSKLNAIMHGKGGKRSGSASGDSTGDVAPDEANGDDSAAGAEKDVEKTEYDYLLNMNLWSLTHEKVEEILKLRDLKKQELDELIATSIESMWDRDLAALTVALDEMDKQDEADELSASNAAEGRKRKRGARSAPAPSAMPVAAAAARSGRSAAVMASDEKLFKQPLISSAREYLDTMKIGKIRWGNTLHQSAEETSGQQSTLSHDVSRPVMAAQAPSGTSGGQGRSRGRGRGGRSASPAPPPARAVAPASSVQDVEQDNGSARLLSRLLHRKGPQEVPAVPQLQHSELGGSDDIFSFLGSSTVESFPSKPPGGPTVTLDAEDPVEVDADEEPLLRAAKSAAEVSRGRGGRGRGRRGGRGGSAPQEDDAPPQAASTAPSYSTGSGRAEDYGSLGLRSFMGLGNSNTSFNSSNTGFGGSGMASGAYQAPVVQTGHVTMPKDSRQPLQPLNSRSQDRSRGRSQDRARSQDRGRSQERGTRRPVPSSREQPQDGIVGHSGGSGGLQGLLNRARSTAQQEEGWVSSSVPSVDLCTQHVDLSAADGRDAGRSAPSKRRRRRMAIDDDDDEDFVL